MILKGQNDNCIVQNESKRGKNGHEMNKDLDSLEHSYSLFSLVFVFRIRQSKDGAIP